MKQETRHGSWCLISFDINCRRTISILNSYDFQCMPSPRHTINCVEHFFFLSLFKWPTRHTKRALSPLNFDGLSKLKTFSICVWLRTNCVATCRTKSHQQQTQLFTHRFVQLRTKKKKQDCRVWLAEKERRKIVYRKIDFLRTNCRYYVKTILIESE